MKRAKNEKIIKKLTSIIFILIAVILIIVGFVGVYLPKHNKLLNKIPDYTLGTELDGVMEFRFSPDTSEEEKKVYVDENGNIKGEVVESTDTETTEDETSDINTQYDIETRIVKANEESVLTKENFEEVKDIVDSRLKNMGSTDYAIRMDNVTGNMIVELSKNDDTGFLYEYALSYKGDFTIIDKQTGVILLDNSNIKTSYATIAQTSETGYTVYLQIELNEESTKKLKDISNKYIEYTKTDGETQIDYIDIKLDDKILMSTYFGEEYTNSILNIAIGGETTDSNVANSNAEIANAYVEIINSGKLPVTYTSDSQLFIKSAVQDTTVQIIFIIMYVVLVIALIVLTIRFKLAGFIAGILNAGFIALVTILLRYLEVTISISSLMSLFVAIGLNIMFLYIYLSKRNQDEAFLETIKKYYLIIMPVIIISFIFTFFVSEAISGIGYVLFWSLLIQIIYNFVFVRLTINDK